MKALCYPIELLEPTLVTSIEGDPNSAVAYDFLPGSVLRGAIVRKYLAAHPVLTPQTLLQADQPESLKQEVQRLFFGGSTQYLNGYLQADGKRTLPTPLAWQQPKGETATVYDFSVAEVQDERKWQGMSGRFCEFVDGKVRLVKPDRQIAVHTARNRRYGRPQHSDRVEQDEDPGAIYRYEALAAGQTFEAIILCEDADAALLQGLLVDAFNLGGSRTGGYGRARLGEVQVIGVDDWREVEGSLKPAVNDRLTLTLLSDGLLRDANGQFVVDPAVMTQHVQRVAPGLGDAMEAFVRGRIVGGFNRKWGLPLPQGLAVQAGSVLVFDVSWCSEGQRQTLAAQLRKLELNGIGERRAEGFGRIAANWHTAAQWTVAQPCHCPQDPIKIEDEQAKELARQMAGRLLRHQLDEALLAKANRLEIEPAPKRAQLARLRGLIANELGAERKPARVKEFVVNSIEIRSAARRQFERARIERKKLTDWLKDTADKTGETEFKELFELGDAPPKKIGTVEPTLSDELRAEYVLRLIDLALAHAAKEGEA